MLHEILSKIDALQAEIHAKRPLDAAHLKSLKAYYKIGLAWSSNAMEGNTLTESETKVVIEDGLTIGGKTLREHLEATGHAEAYDFMFSLVKNSSLTESDIQNLHRLFYAQIDGAQAGVYRSTQVFLSGSKYPLTKPQDIPAAMAGYVRQVDAYRLSEHPVVSAAKAHKDFVFIHPFIDGNGRVARLIMNCLLLQADYSLAVIGPVLRQNYIAALEAARVDDSEFIQLIMQCVYQTQKDYLRLLD